LVISNPRAHYAAEHIVLKGKGSSAGIRTSGQFQVITMIRGRAGIYSASTRPASRRRPDMELRQGQTVLISAALPSLEIHSLGPQAELVRSSVI
jgi:hypothetical protein